MRPAQLFTIKRKLDPGEFGSSMVSSWTAVNPGTAMAVIPETGGRFPPGVLDSLRDQLASLVAMDKRDNQIQRKRGTRLKLVFYQQSDKGYSFVAKVRSYETVQSRTAPLTVFGKVRRVRPHPSRGGKMHLQFTRMSLCYPNQVHRYVYEFQTAHPAQRRVAAH